MSAKMAGTDRQLTDEELVTRIQSGDRESLSILVKGYITKVYNKV